MRRTDGSGVGVGVGVTVGILVDVGVIVGVGVRVAVGAGVLVGVSVLVGVGVGVGVGVAVDSGARVGIGLGDGRDWSRCSVRLASIYNRIDTPTTMANITININIRAKRIYHSIPILVASLRLGDSLAPRALQGRAQSPLVCWRGHRT